MVALSKHAVQLSQLSWISVYAAQRSCSAPFSQPVHIHIFSRATTRSFVIFCGMKRRGPKKRIDKIEMANQTCPKPPVIQLSSTDDESEAKPNPKRVIAEKILVRKKRPKDKDGKMLDLVVNTDPPQDVWADIAAGALKPDSMVGHIRDLEAKVGPSLSQCDPRAGVFPTGGIFEPVIRPEGATTEEIDNSLHEVNLWRRQFECGRKKIYQLLEDRVDTYEKSLNSMRRMQFKRMHPNLIKYFAEKGEGKRVYGRVRRSMYSFKSDVIKHGEDLIRRAQMLPDHDELDEILPPMEQIYGPNYKPNIYRVAKSSKKSKSSKKGKGKGKGKSSKRNLNVEPKTKPEAEPEVITLDSDNE